MRAMKKLLSLVTLLGVTSVAASAALAGEPRKVVTIEGITEYRMDNGLRVLLFPDDSKQQVTVNITYLVGSRHEGYGETGMAHLLEHMMFKGTHDATRRCGSELDAHGARFNGTTWYDRTNYFETLPATDENLEWALDSKPTAWSTRACRRRTWRRSSRSCATSSRWARTTRRTILEERAAGRRRTCGTTTASRRSARAATSSACPIDSLQRVLRRATTSRTTRSSSSPASSMPKRRSRSIQSTFGEIPRPSAQAPAPRYTVEPVQDGERPVTLRRTGDVGVVGLVYHGAAGAGPRLRRRGGAASTS